MEIFVVFVVLWVLVSLFWGGGDDGLDQNDRYDPPPRRYRRGRQDRCCRDRRCEDCPEW